VAIGIVAVLESLGISLGDWEAFFDLTALWQPSENEFYLLCLLCGLSAWFTSRILGGPPLLTAPIAAILFLVLGFFINGVAARLMPGTITDFERIIVFTMLGNGLGAMLLLVAFKAAEARSR